MTVAALSNRWRGFAMVLLAMFVGTMLAAIASPASAATCPQFDTSAGTFNAIYDPATNHCTSGSTPQPGQVHIGWFQGPSTSISVWDNTGTLLPLISSSLTCAVSTAPGSAGFNIRYDPMTHIGCMGPATYSFSFVATTPAGTSLTFSGSFSCFALTCGSGTMDMQVIVTTAPSPGPSADNVERTMRVIHNFMATRANQITSNDPDLADRLLRHGAATSGSPVTVSGGGTDGNGSFAFATSLRQIAQSNAAAKAQPDGMMGLGAHTASLNSTGPAPTFDVWVEGKGAHVDGEASNSDIGLFYVGAEYRWNPNVLVGVIVQVDWTKESNTFEDASVGGTGWMAGPYVVARLSENLIFDARAAWGTSSNSVTPVGTYSDNFDGDRWLVRARFTGDFSYGAFVINPQASIVYFDERQQSYIDSQSNYIPSQSVGLGQLEFGPKVGYRYREADGSVVTPYAAVKGVWDFKEAQIYDLASGLAVGTGDLRARFESGVSAAFVNGWTINGEGFYDGAGASDFSAFGGTLSLSVPLE